MVFRVDPQLPAGSYKTYQVVRPRATHWRRATCAEVDCAASLCGWATTVDVGTDLGRRQANYIRLHSGRAFTAAEAGTLVTFTFPAGQVCFAEHQVPVERDPVYAVRDGDWRGNPRGTRPRVHRNGDDWVDDFATHQQGLADRLEQG